LDTVADIERQCGTVSQVDATLATRGKTSPDKENIHVGIMKPRRTGIVGVHNLHYANDGSEETRRNRNSKREKEPQGITPHESAGGIALHNGYYVHHPQENQESQNTNQTPSDL